MLNSKLVKGFVLGLGLTVMLSTAAFAEENAVAPDMAVSTTASATAPQTIDVMPVKALGQASDAMYKKQSEIDKYLFEEHKDEMAKKGITVTHTVAGKDFVEVGITPFTKENEDFIYLALGRDQVKVVEGTLVLAYDAGAANGGEGLMYATGVNDDELMYATGAPVEETEVDGAPADDVKVVMAPTDAQIYTMTAETTSAKTSANLSVPTISAIAAAVLVLLGGILYSARRVRAAKR